MGIVSTAFNHLAWEAFTMLLSPPSPLCPALSPVFKCHSCGGPEPEAVLGCLYGEQLLQWLWRTELRGSTGKLASSLAVFLLPCPLQIELPGTRKTCPLVIKSEPHLSWTKQVSWSMLFMSSCSMAIFMTSP